MLKKVFLTREVMKERLEFVKNKLVEKMKEEDKRIRDRRASVTLDSVGSIERPMKRQYSGAMERGRSLVRRKPSTTQ